VEDGERDDGLASVETSGASVDEAIQQALDQLDLTPEDVDVEVLDPGGSGRPARVRRGRPGGSVRTSICARGVAPWMALPRLLSSQTSC